MTLQNSINTPGALMAFSAAVPFDKISIAHATHAVPGAIAFTIAAGTKLPGARTTYRLIANGANEPTFTGFVESSESVGYDNRNTIVNVIEFFFDGIDHWYRIWQPKGAAVGLTPVAITFPARTAGVIQASNTYTTNTAGDYADQIASAQTIPTNKAGRITFRTDSQIVVGLKSIGTAQAYANFVWGVFIFNGDNQIYTFVGGSGILASGIFAGANDVFFRITRNSNGTAFVEYYNGSAYVLVRNFANINANALYVGADISGVTATRQLDIVSFEIEP